MVVNFKVFGWNEANTADYPVIWLLYRTLASWVAITMENKIKKSIYCDNEREIIDLLNSGLDPNYKSGWPIRLAARHGAFSVVKALIQYGANPHLLSEAGKLNYTNIYL